MYKQDIERIKNADLKYPIIIVDKHVIDGVHRLTRAYLEGKKKIKPYRFTKQQLKKFVIANEGEWGKVDGMEIHNYIQLFYKRFY